MHPFNFGGVGSGASAFSLRGNNHHIQHPSNGLHSHNQQQQQRGPGLRRIAVSAVAAATAGAAGWQLHRQGKLPVPLFRQRGAKPVTTQQGPPFLIPKEVAEILCGAFGEIVQVAVLYPLDTIKVRCQAGGLPVGGVVRQLMAAGSPGAVLGQLYAGVASASLASVAVGSLYYFTFCAAKRATTRMVTDAENKAKTPTTNATLAVTAGTVVPLSAGHDNSSNGSSQQHQQHQLQAALSHNYPHGAAVDYHSHDPVFAAICSDDAAARAAAAAKNGSSNVQPTAGNSSGSSSTTATTNSKSSSSSSSSEGSSAEATAEISHQGRLQANILAACAAALVGALVEAPVELFKHRAQAGQITGSMLGHVVSALKKQGPVALYGSFFLPFCFKSLPFDIGELMTYSSLQDWKERQLAAAAAAPGAPAVAATSAVAVETGRAAVPAAAAGWEDTAQQQQQQQQQQQRGVLALGSITAASSDLAAVTLTTGTGSSRSSSSSGSSQQQQQFLSAIPDHVWDMAIGGAAGAAAVLVSMPPDCIKTVMETGSGVPVAAGSGPFGSATAFMATGRQLVQQRGVGGGLFMGLAPRLIESVPSTMLYWLAVEGFRRVLEPYTAK